MLGAGRLDKRVTLQEPVVERNAIGEGVTTWQDVASVWAAVEPVNGREFWAQQQVQSEVTVKITIRHRDDVSQAMRVVWNSKVYNIKSVIDPMTRHENLVLMCGEGLNNG